MKVSKVNHTKAAVGVSKNNSDIKGFIYDNPYVYKNKELSTIKRISKLNKNAKNLYNIFNPQITYTDNREIIQVCNKIKRHMSYLISNFMKIHTNDKDARIKLQIKTFKCLDTSSILCEIKNHKTNTSQYISLNDLDISNYPAGLKNGSKECIINDLVENCLRKGLRRTIRGKFSFERIEIKEVVKKLIKAVTTPKEFQKICSEISYEEWYGFFDNLNEDYEKEKRIINIATSIEHQNVKIQPIHVGNDIVLHLSNADKSEEKKENIKKYIFKFLTDYTKENIEGQKKMIIHIRQLILLFCTVAYMEDGTPDVEKNKKTLDYVISEKRFEDLTLDMPKYFCKEAYDALKERDEIRNCNNNLNGGLSIEQKRKKKNLTNEIIEKIRNQIMINYTSCKKLIIIHGFFEYGEDSKNNDICWLDYISATVEKILIKKKKWKHHLSIRLLCKIVFDEWTAYIAQKYIEMGKAVYHFAMPDLSRISGKENVRIGMVRKQFADGLSSFDYERIKAEETLERDLIVSITFAAQNYSRCVCNNEQRMKNGKEDILQYNEKDFLKILGEKDKKQEIKQEVIRKILQFWGGMSKWKDQVPDIVGNRNENTIRFVQAIKNEISLVRNSCYHYTAAISENAVAEPLMKKMFAAEYGCIGQIIFDKYYSNNVFLFYSITEIKKLSDHLYSCSKVLPAQIPSFRRIVGHQNIDEFIIKCIGNETWGKELSDIEIRKTYRASFLFLLKEIYYHSFLYQNGIKERFLKKIQDKKERSSDKKEKAASNNMYNRLNALEKTLSFGEICQVLMTDYNMQNQGNMNVKVKAKSEQNKESTYDKEIFQHFRMLLYIGIREVFSDYLTSKIFACLKHPKVIDNIKKEDAFQRFTGNKKWNPGLFSDIYRETDIQSAKIDPELLAWYTTAHFINPKQLNLLIGSFKNYIQFVNDIHKRELTANIKMPRKQNVKKIEKCIKIIRILEFTQLFNGQTTNCLKDYFKNKDEYARHVASYVHLDNPTKESLQAFCEQNINPEKPNDRFGIYFDTVNPIVNRNIVFASMYGMEQILKECVEPVEENEILELYKLKESLKGVFEKGVCSTKQEQKKLRNFANQKNRIELVNIMTYSEIINDLFGQLVSWTYLRERDLMYFQLGYYYIKLFCGEKDERDEWMRTLNGDGIDIRDGAILYQIAAMYTYILPVYEIHNGKAVVVLPEGSSGASVNVFYKDYCRNDESVYNAGLFFFEILDEHDFIIAGFRNEIDHFKYFARAERSILEYYAQIYDRFFDYDLKLKKSMTFILKNILARYFVVADFSMNSESGMIEHRKTGTKEKPEYVYRRCTCLKIKERGLSSSLMDYKKNGRIEARDEKFLKEVRNILEYKKSK